MSIRCATPGCPERAYCKYRQGPEWAALCEPHLALVQRIAAEIVGDGDSEWFPLTDGEHARGEIGELSS